jgi:hypothetical protein
VSDEQRQLEWNALRWLCSNHWPPSKRKELAQHILPRAAELFQTEECRVVLEEIAALGKQPIERIRELLPARVTNRGLPDVDFSALFAGDEVSREEAAAIEKWLRLI